MHVLVLLNARAGTLVSASEHDQPATIRERFATHSIDADVREVPGDGLADVVAEARASKRFDLIIAGGGDGTLNTIAAALVVGDASTRVPLGVLPLGTFNHLAKELAIPLELSAAVDALATGRDIPFNVGQVNGQTFLLFAAIGFYADMIKHRDAQRKTLGRRKMWAGTIAFWKILFRWPLMRVKFCNVEPPDIHPPAHRQTSVVYVSLSSLQLSQLGVPDVPTDTRATLNVLVSRHVNRRGLVWQIIKAMCRHLVKGKDLEWLRVDAIEIDPRGHASIRVGYDGEVISMDTPLKFNLIRDGLTMRVPKGET